jgi:transposase-like protein
VFDLKWVEFTPTPLPDSVPRIPATQEMYVDSMGLRCPFCGSEAIYTGNTHLHAGCLDQEINCDECHTTWYDQYTLTGYTTTKPE